MPLLITKPMLGDINTISIPTDAIFTISLLIVLSLIGYCFHSILTNNTNQFAEKIDADSKLVLDKEELEDRLALELTTHDDKTVEKPRITKLNFLPSAKLLGLGSLAIVGMGGASLLGLQNLQKSYEKVSTSQANVTIETKSRKKQLSVMELKSLYKQQKNIKEVSYIDPFLSTIKNSKENRIYQVKERQFDNIFSF